MAHEFTSGVFMHGQAAWHGLGEVIEGTLPAHEAFTRAGALFPVETVPLWAGNPADLDADDPLPMVPLGAQRVAIWRPDTRQILGTATGRYRVVPNQRLLDFASAIREEVDMDSVIVLRDGAKVAFTAKIRGTDREVIPGDRVFRRIVGYLGHDGQTAFGGMFTNIRVVCANTLGFALSDADRHGRQFTVRHTEAEVQQIDRILEGIDFARQSFDQTVDTYRAMQATRMDTDAFRAFLENVYQLPAVKLHGGEQRPGTVDDMPRRWKRLRDAWYAGLGSNIPGVRNTLYGALNAITEVESSERASGAGAKRFHSANFGGGASVIRRAEQLSRALVRV